MLCRASELKRTERLTRNNLLGADLEILASGAPSFSGRYPRIRICGFQVLGQECHFQTFGDAWPAWIIASEGPRASWAQLGVTFSSVRIVVWTPPLVLQLIVQAMSDGDVLAVACDHARENAGRRRGGRHRVEWIIRRRKNNLDIRHFWLGLYGTNQRWIADNPLE